MAEDAFEDLVKSVDANGLIEPITLLDYKILDGRNRYNACMKAGVEPSFVPFEGDDPLAFVLSKNLIRRHLNESQRALAAARLANMRQGEHTDKPSAHLQKVSQSNAAHLLNVSTRSVASANKALGEGAPELVRAIESGDVTVSVAEKIAGFSCEDQKKILEDDRPDMAIKKQRRAIREAELGGEIAALPGKKYGVIYADPPWRLDAFSGNGLARAPDNHYPTLSTDEICALDVASIAAEDCVLFLWAIVPMLPDALKAMRAWGFEYRSHMVWNKDKIGLGYWFRNKHEILLVVTRGNIPVPARGEQWESVQDAPVGKHSEKPEIFYKMIEEYFPSLPKIELFARGQIRKGWETWGNEAQPASKPDEKSGGGDCAGTGS